MNRRNDTLIPSSLMEQVLDSNHIQERNNTSKQQNSGKEQYLRMYGTIRAQIQYMCSVHNRKVHVTAQGMRMQEGHVE
jgi:hypothetical protein